MGKLAVVALALIAVLAPAGANAQVDDPDAPSLEPLRHVLSGFSSGTPIDGLTTSPSSEAAETITSQFQIVVNLGAVPSFGQPGLDLVPSGFPRGSQTELVSLLEWFSGSLDEFSYIPPLDPWARGEGTDLSGLLDGWTAVGEDGLIEDPVAIFEPLQAVWGVELAEPFDLACPETAFVGRAWEGSSVSSGPDPFFTGEALGDRYSGTHDALVDSRSRMVQLICPAGGSPLVLAQRMTDDKGIRPFGPTRTVALVRDNYVVFFSPVRIHDSDLRQFFFATPAGGGQVAVSEVDSDYRVLVPNPYDVFNTRVTINIDIPEVDAFHPGQDVQAQTLLHRPAETEVALVGTGGCPPVAGEFFVRDLILGAAAAEDSDTLFVRDHSTIGTVVTSPGRWEILVDYADGSSDWLTIDVINGIVETKVNLAGEPECEGTGIALVNGEPLDGGDSGGSGSDPDDSSTEAPPSSDEPSAGEEGSATDTGGGGGVPWVPIGIALALLGGIAVGMTRTRNRGKNCEPEKAAYAAADTAYDKAKNASDYWQGEYEHFRSEYEGYRQQLENRLPRPDRLLGYPEGPDGDQAYADDLAHWEQQEADAETAQHNLDGAREAMESARSSRDEADAALQTAREALERARLALLDCQGSAPPGVAGETPPPGPGISTPPPEEPSTGCTEGATKVKVESRRQFQVLGGQVQIDIPAAAWRVYAVGGRIGPERLADLSQDELEGLFADLDNQIEAVPIRASVPTRTLTVKCTRTMVCRNGEWVETEETRRVEESAKGPDIAFQQKAKDKRIAARMVAEAQAKVAELRANQAAADGTGCD